MRWTEQDLEQRFGKERAQRIMEGKEKAIVDAVSAPEDQPDPGRAHSGFHMATNKSQPQQLEHQEQVKLFEMAEQAKAAYPELELLNGSLNGVRLTIGQAKKAKRAGMRRGYPDVFLPAPRGGYAGLYIEMKTKDGRIRPEQQKWLVRLEQQDYCCKVCYSAVEAWDVIIDYLHR